MYMYVLMILSSGLPTTTFNTTPTKQTPTKQCPHFMLQSLQIFNHVQIGALRPWWLKNRHDFDCNLLCWTVDWSYLHIGVLDRFQHKSSMWLKYPQIMKIKDDTLQIFMLS